VTGANPFDGRAVHLVPQTVEKLPLWHWRPGARMLAVGSRDGTGFDGELDPSEANSYRRELSVGLVREARARADVLGIHAAWSESLRYPAGLRCLLAAADGPITVATAGFGEETVLEEIATRVAAWVLHLGEYPGPLAKRIVERADHVEVVLGLPDPGPPPELRWDRVAAVHLVPRRAHGAVGRQLDDWERVAADLVGPGPTVYTQHDRHTRCACGETLVWRSGGRSRRDRLAGDGRCSTCGAPSNIRP